MARNQLLFSVLIVVQLLAIAVGVIPSIEDFGRDTTPPTTATGSVRSYVTAGLDRLAPTAVRLHRIIWASTKPLRRPAAFYLRATSQYEKWNMFSTPNHRNQFARLDYHVERADGTQVVTSELVFPAKAHGDWRLIASYPASFTDKAFNNAFDRYGGLISRAERRGAPLPTELMAQCFRPFLAEYGRRVAARLPQGAKLRSVELWKGAAPMPEPGETLSHETVAARAEALSEIGTAGSRVDLVTGHGTVPPTKTADIVWARLAAEDYVP